MSVPVALQAEPRGMPGRTGRTLVEELLDVVQRVGVHFFRFLLSVCICI